MIRMVKISFITFTLNCSKELNRLLRHVEDVVDEIIVIDGMSSDDTIEVAKSFGARVFLRKPWGYADPDRMFALKKCSYDWVLYLDVDERLCCKLKSELRQIVENLIRKGYVAAKINSVPIIKRKPTFRKFMSWQIRIFNRRYVKYKGIVHELPEVAGAILKLDPRKYYILHFKGNSWIKLWRHSVKYAYLEKLEIYRMRNYIERASLELRISPLISPLIIAEKLVRNPPLTLHSIAHSLLHGFYRVLVLTLMVFRTRREEHMAEIVQERGFIQLLRLDQ